MKQVVFTLTVFFLFSIACTEQINEDQIDEIQITDLAKYNMKIIPANPTSNDEISLIIYDDCKYNTLSGIKKNGQIIDIEKQFNSMMKWPCMLHNDTILIGKLPQGTYKVNYHLVDIANQNSPQISLSVSFNLPVSMSK
jgi:hypothetical protein